MGSGWIILVELVLVLGLVLGFGVWQLLSLRRDRRATAQRAAADTPAVDAGAAAPESERRKGRSA